MKILIILVIELCFAALSISQWISQGQTRSCITPQNQYGSCVPLSYCPQVANIFQASNPQDGRQFLISLQRACGTRSINGDPVICCSRSLSVPSNMFAQRETQNPFFSSTISPALPPTTTIKIMPSTTIAPKAENKISGFCRDPNGIEGYCTGLATCQSLVKELYAKRDDISFKNFLRVSNAICGGMSTFVCCPGQEENKTSQKNESASKIDNLVPTAKDGCGYSTNSYKKIVGGEPAKKGSWPWIALLGYDDDLSPNPFKCGGSLVTKRHVVTAAHCIRSDLTFVRLGEHDLETLTEAKHIDVKIVTKITHPEYNPKNGRADIAIVFLERNIELSDNISPICLPISKELRNKSYVKYSPFVAGWGKTMMNGYSASVLQELQIPILENDECRRRYAARNRLFTQNQFDEAVICAGVLAGGKDTCQGDSGGPLMIPEPFEKSVRYYLIGVVSYGIGCAQPDIPGVYSSVQYFIDWILGEISKVP